MHRNALVIIYVCNKRLYTIMYVINYRKLERNLLTIKIKVCHCTECNKATRQRSAHGLSARQFGYLLANGGRKNIAEKRRWRAFQVEGIYSTGPADGKKQNGRRPFTDFFFLFNFSFEKASAEELCIERTIKMLEMLRIDFYQCD